MKIPTDLTNWRKRDDGLWARRTKCKQRNRNSYWSWRLYYERICSTCKEHFLARKSSADANPNWGRHCSNHCVPHPGKLNPNWKGGKRNHNGYVYVSKLGHPNADKRGNLHESRLVASGMYGRPIADGEEVHHMNQDRADNRQFNLVILTIAEHRAVHKRLRRLAKRGRRNG